MISAHVDIVPLGSESFNLGGMDNQSGVEDWLCDLDFSDLPQLPIEADVANLPLLTDPFVLEGTGSPESVSSIWQPEDTCVGQVEDFDVTDEDIETWKLCMNSPLFPVPVHSSKSGEAASASRVEQASPLSSPDLSVGNTECHVQSAETAQVPVGSALGSCADERMADPRIKEQLDPSQKKEKRLLRNRELAFESRQRKKSYIQELELKCRVLEQECKQLQHQICLVSSENTVWKEELSRVKRKKGSTGVAEPAVLMDSLPLEFLLHLTYLSFLASMSLLGNPYLHLLLVSVHLQMFKIKPGRPVKGEGNSKACSLTSIVSGSLDTGQGFHSSTALRKQCAFGSWRHRRKLYDMTSDDIIFSLWA